MKWQYFSLLSGNLHLCFGIPKAFLTSMVPTHQDYCLFILNTARS
jgi:hypothetical protein